MRFIVLAFMKFWLLLIYNNFILPANLDIRFLTEIIRIIMWKDFWGNALMFATGMLFVHAFHIKIDQIDLEDSKLSGNE